MSNPVTIGIECKAYLLPSASGTRSSWGAQDGNGNAVGAAPAGLTEVKIVRDVTVTLGAAEADVSSRASFFELARKALKQLSIDIEIPWVPGDSTFQALLASYNVSGLSVAMAFLDGDKATNGSQGPWADWEVFEFTREEGLKKEVLAKVKLKPTSSAVAPEWAKVG